MDYEQLVTVMRRLSIEAGDKIMEIYGQDDFDVVVSASAVDPDGDALTHQRLGHVAVTRCDNSARAFIASGKFQPVTRL